MNAKKQFSRLGFSFSLFWVVAMAGSVVLSLVWMLAQMVITGRDMTTSVTAAMLLSQIAMYGCGFPVFYLMVKKLPAWKKESGPGMSAGQFFLCLVFCLGLTYLGGLVGDGLMKLAGLAAGKEFASPVDEMVNEMHPLALVLSIAVVAPVMEELMFRKFLVDRTVQYGQKTAVIVSGVCFGLFHGNFFQFFYACTLGMVFAYVYSCTGKIRYNILLHMCINLIGGAVPMLLMHAESWNKALASFGSLALVGVMIVSMVCAVVMLIMYIRKLSFFPAWERPQTGGICRAVVTAPGMIVFFLTCAVMFALS